MDKKKGINAPIPIRVKALVLGSSGAGKTSFNRRYFHGTYEEHRKSTICADFYSRIVPNPLYVPIDGSVSKRKIKKKDKKKKKHKKKKISKTAMTNEEEASESVPQSTPQHCNLPSENMPSHDPSIYQNPTVALQIWDTAGNSRLSSESAGGLTSRLGDAFFRHANVAILIYDATSSRSFLQLIKWHKELLERIKRAQNRDGMRLQNGFGKGENGNINGVGYHRTQFPVLVVATKLDRLKAEQSKSGNIRTVPQRNVLGLSGFYKGIDNYYEYGAVDGIEVQQHLSSNHINSQHNLENSGNNNLPHGAAQDNMISMFGLEGDWNMDTSYMNYVRLAEDECFPDREMVKRWCRRQGLLHIEVSALENKGVDTAVEAAVTIALKGMQEQKMVEDSIVREKYNSLESKPDQSHNSPRNEGTSKSGKGQNDECHFCRFLIPNILQRAQTRCII